MRRLIFGQGGSKFASQRATIPRMTQDRTYMRMALAEALKAQAVGEVPVGAVVVKDGQVIGVGYNAPIASHDPTAHAEIVAMRAAALTLGNYRLDGCELFVTLEPCVMCAGAMLHARLARVVYGAREPKTGAAGSAVDLFSNTQINHHTAITEGVLASECAATLQSFFLERRQVRALQAQPLSDDALRTPTSVFGALQGYPFTSRYFNAGPALRGWRMHYLDEGSTDSTAVVLCLHDVTGWSYRFRSLIPALAKKGMRVVVPDMIGFGMSDKPKKDAAHTVALHLESLGKLLEHLQLSSLVVVGEGTGIQVARLLVSMLPNSALQVCQLWTGTEAMMDASEADGLPYPDKGYQAGLRAAPRLTKQLATAVTGLASADSGPEYCVWNGDMNTFADHLQNMFLRR